MKKASAKANRAQGCLKISTFFTKLTSENSLKPQKNLIPSKTIVLDSDEESESLLSFKSFPTHNKRKLETTEFHISPPTKKGTPCNIASFSPKPSTSGLTSNDPKDDVNINKTATNEMYPSMKGVTPVKNKPHLSIKSPENLLNVEALKEYNSPEKVMERFIFKGSKKFTSVKSNSPEKNIIKQMSVKSRSFSLDNVNTTPPKNKITGGSDKNSFGLKNEKLASNRTEKSPVKNRRSPKLFNRSPINLSEFNVEILKNFIKVTPSKSSKKGGDSSNQAEESSSKKSLEVQTQNEKTPEKDVMASQSSYLSPISKAKTKLDFSKCTNGINGETNIKNTHNENIPLENSKENEETNECAEKENIDLNNLDIYFDDSWDKFYDQESDYSLDLTQSQHCKIVTLDHKTSEIILTLKSTKTNMLALCTLQGFWIHSKLCIGDSVHISATKLENNEWLVDNQNGFMVYEPDFLISTTSIVNSVFCKRRTVFKEKIRGFEPTNKFMIVGSMVHILLQNVLSNKLYNYKEIEKCARDILTSKEWIKQIYESGETAQNIGQDFLMYVPKVCDFVSVYVQNGAEKKNPKFRKKDDWQGTILGIDDIEENIWCPDLGIKGKVDVSVKNGVCTMPLEVKTGRASVSLEHRGQVLLYIMMMTKLGYTVSSGLLLYLKEGTLKEIATTSAEKRDIMILRNELSYYLSRKPKICEDANGKYLEPCEIPEPIDHPCCTKCPYNAICVSYASYTNEDISSKKSLNLVQAELGNYITSAHINYYMHWSSLLVVEMTERNGQKNLRDIYTLSPKERKNRGKCLINLKITNVAAECNGTFEHKFEEHDDSQNTETMSFMLSGFMENTYVIVSVDNRPAVATGFITDISKDYVTVALDRNLTKKYSNREFYIDSYDSTAFLNYNLASLSLILDTSERSNRLRNIIVDRRPATFQAKLPKILAEKSKPILKRLNRVQQRAVLKAIAANEYFLIKGMPGTGKTATIVALVELLLQLNKSVLITSHTHSAVDNVCIKLVKFGVKVMRLGNNAKIDPSLREFSEHNLTKHCKTAEELDQVYSSARVLAVTCLGSGHSILSKRTLDICIVDESTQVLQCSVFRPLYAAKTFILIGDPDQLPAVVRNKDAIQQGMNESLFERLNTEESCISLNLNYRMNEPITALANALTYNGELLIGADRIAKATLKVNSSKLSSTYKNSKWILKALDTSLDKAVQFIDTGPIWNLKNSVPWAKTQSFDEDLSEHKNCLNVFEAAVVYHLVHALLMSGVTPDQIGVIATYRAQVAQILQLLESTKVAINTVDQFQGKDKNVIIYSCSKSKDLSKDWVDNKFDLLEDKRRLNVAITRAKHKLIIVGDMATLQKYSTFRKIQSCLEKNVIRLLKCEGFDWKGVLDIQFTLK